MNILIADFLKSFSSEKDFLVNKVTCFKGEDYPYLFFSLLFKKLKQENKIQINYINIDETNISSIKLNLEQFLFAASNIFVWLGDISNFKKKDELLLYLNSYKGPYSVGFFIKNEIQSNEDQYNVINCNVITSVEDLNSIIFLWNKKDQRIILQFIKAILQRTNKINLDQLCIFVNYSTLLGNKYSNFMDGWLEKILINDYSLFNLSKYLFSNDSKSFFKYWNLVSASYAPVFWTTFWSEQLYRAINFIDLRNQNKNLQAKQIAYKLPFSFIQTDWKKYSIQQLQNAHQQIYEIDYSLKNGATDISLDLFYTKFFEKEFR